MATRTGAPTRNSTTSTDNHMRRQGESKTMDSNTDRKRPRALAGLSRRGATAAAAFGLMTGGVLGGYLVSHAASNTSSSSDSSAATTAPASGSGSSSSSSGSTGSGTTAPAPNGSSTGTFHSNENAAHEAGESAAREAQENAGQMPTVP